MNTLTTTLAFATAATVFATGAAQAADVALFTNTTYVNYSPGNANAEASNLEATLTAQGHAVTTFTSTAAAGIAIALAGQDALLVPRLTSDLFGALGTPEQDEIKGFVETGGNLIVFHAGGSFELGLVNGLLGISLVPGGAGTSAYSLNSASIVNTAFKGGPLALAHNTGTIPVDLVPFVNLPTPRHSRVVYSRFGVISPEVAVGVIPVGCGWLTLMGWSWVDAQPVGAQDGGWLEVLDRALGQLPRELAANDFDGDCRGDILWRNRSTGGVFVWLSGEFPVSATDKSSGIGKVLPPWEVAGTGDFDKDGKADVFWHNPTTGHAIVWLMDGFFKTVVPVGAPHTDWRPEGVKDYTGDGLADVLWRNTTTKTLLIWIMDSVGKIGALPVGNADTTFTVEE